jgi:hypothetical protein
MTGTTNTSSGNYDGTIKVAGNDFVNSAGQILHLVGINNMNMVACPNNTADDPSAVAHVALIAVWKANVVRIPMDEDCWLGINGAVNSGATYQTTILNYVTALHNNNMYAILCLCGVAPSTIQSTIYPVEMLPDSDHSPAFWSSVAAAFKNDPGVIFDVYGEPNGLGGTAGWNCWISGGDSCGLDSTHSIGYRSSGAQTLINDIRAAGATTQPILVAGLNYAEDMSRWLEFKPTDPSNSIAASYHIYDTYGCAPSCYTGVLLPILAANYPVVTSEFGEFDCAGGFVTPYMNWADQNNVQYLAWAWNKFSCTRGPSLLSDYDGTTTAYGAAIKTHLQAIAPRPARRYSLVRALFRVPSLAKKWLHAHSTRHSAAVAMLKSVVDVLSISQWLGDAGLNAAKPIRE